MTTPYLTVLALADKHLPHATSGDRLALVADVLALLDSRKSDQRGSTLIAVLVLTLLFAAILATCLLARPEVTPLLDQVSDSVGQFIGGAL